MADCWEVKHPDGRGVTSSLPYCGYTRDTLLSLQRAGFSVYKNGEKQKIGRGGSP